MYVMRMFFCEEIEDTIVEDEIDELFSKLERVEPPPFLIEDIMSTVAHLPLPQYLPPMDEDELNEIGIITPFSAK